MGRGYGTQWKKANAYRVVVGILKKRNHLDLKRTNWDGVDCIHLAQVRDKWQVLVNMVNIPSGAKRIWEFLDQLKTVSFS